MKSITITDRNFQTEVLNSSLPVLLDFWTTWCGTCVPLGKIVDELAEEYDGKFKVGKIDADSNHNVSIDYGVRSMPTILIFKDGQVVDSVIGLVKKSVLIEKIELHLN